jgi:hypothetical protein
LEPPQLPALTRGDLSAQGAKGIVGGDLVSQLIGKGESQRRQGVELHRLVSVAA